MGRSFFSSNYRNKYIRISKLDTEIEIMTTKMMRIFVNKLIMYSMILIVVFFYPELAGQRCHNVNDMRGINYIPKSKQTVYDRWTRSLKTWTRKLLRGLDNRIMSIKTPITLQKRRDTVTLRERGMSVLLAMSVIAMRAEGP